MYIYIYIIFLLGGSSESCSETKIHGRVSKSGTAVGFLFVGRTRAVDGCELQTSRRRSETLASDSIPPCKYQTTMISDGFKVVRNGFRPSTVRSNCSSGLGDTGAELVLPLGKRNSASMAEWQTIEGQAQLSCPRTNTSLGVDSLSVEWSKPVANLVV